MRDPERVRALHQRTVNAQPDCQHPSHPRRVRPCFFSCRSIPCFRSTAQALEALAWRLTLAAAPAIARTILDRSDPDLEGLSGPGLTIPARCGRP